jgi:gamma-glutamyltranspeptidase/glutathione hydrolase
VLFCPPGCRHETAYFALLSALLAAGCSHAPRHRTRAAPPPLAECISRKAPPAKPTVQPGWSGQYFAIAAAHPLASDAGLEILQAGGSAVDAAIAAQMVLTLVEPQSSGIGGGAFLMHYDGREITAFDGRETAPAGVSETLFTRADGKPMAFREAVVGGRAVGVPGTVRMLEMAHAEYGRLPWSRLFAPAISARRGWLPAQPSPVHPAQKRARPAQGSQGRAVFL